MMKKLVLITLSTTFVGVKMSTAEILVCSDLSKDDNNLVMRALQLAKFLNASVTVIHAIDPIKFQMIKGSSNLLDQIKSHIRESLYKIPAIASGSVRLLLEEGHPSSVIPSAIDRLNANLIVMGIHGNGYVDGQSIGANVSRVLRETICDTLVVKRPATSMYQRVLVPVDFSSISMRTLQAAIYLAPNAHFYIQHTCEIAYEGLLYRSDTDKESIVENRLRELDEIIDKIERLAVDLGMPRDSYTAVVNHGHPRARVIKLENDFGCDLIVIGKHGHSIVQNYLLGSVAAHVLLESVADVLVVS